MTRRRTSTTGSSWRAEHGTSAVEYGLIVAGAAVALIGGVVVMGSGLKAAFIASAQGTQAVGSIDQAAEPRPQEPAPAPTVVASPSDVPSDVPATPAPTPVPTPSATASDSASATASPTTSAGAISVRAGEDATKVDVGATKGSKDLTATVDPERAGSVTWDSREVAFTAARSVPKGTVVTVSWSYTQGGKAYEGALTYVVS